MAQKLTIILTYIVFSAIVLSIVGNEDSICKSDDQCPFTYACCAGTDFCCPKTSECCTGSGTGHCCSSFTKCCGEGCCGIAEKCDAVNSKCIKYTYTRTNIWLPFGGVGGGIALICGCCIACCVKGRKKEFKKESAMPSVNNTNGHDTVTPVVFTVQKPSTKNTLPKPTTTVGLF